MNRRIFDIIDELTKREHHWTWYQLNGKSAQENYELQKAEWRKEFLGRELKELLYAEEAAWAAEATNIEFTIKSEVLLPYLFVPPLQRSVFYATC